MPLLHFRANCCLRRRMNGWIVFLRVAHNNRTFIIFTPFRPISFASLSFCLYFFCNFIILWVNMWFKTKIKVILSTESIDTNKTITIEMMWRTPSNAAEHRQKKTKWINVAEYQIKHIHNNNYHELCNFCFILRVFFGFVICWRKLEFMESYACECVCGVHDCRDHGGCGMVQRPF